MVSGIYADKSRRPGLHARFWRDRHPFRDVGKDFPHVGRMRDVLEECVVGVAGSSGAEVSEDGLEGISQGVEKSGNVIVIGFAVLDVVRADLENF